MTKRLVPLGLVEGTVLATQVGKGMTPLSLVARMPSAEIAAKVGGKFADFAASMRVVRRNARH
jgi:hypothetical protein